MKVSSLAAAVFLLAAVVLYAVQSRYVIAPREASPAVIIYRFDRWTGDLVVLQGTGGGNWKAARLHGSPAQLTQLQTIEGGWEHAISVPATVPFLPDTPVPRPTITPKAPDR